MCPALLPATRSLSNGTINIGANQSFANLSGNSAVTLSTGTPTLTVNDAVNTAFAGNISGATLDQDRQLACLTLTSSNNLSGNLFVKASAH